MVVPSGINQKGSTSGGRYCTPYHEAEELLDARNCVLRIITLSNRLVYGSRKGVELFNDSFVENITECHCSEVQCLYFLVNANRSDKFFL